MRKKQAVRASDSLVPAEPSAETLVAPQSSIALTLPAALGIGEVGELHAALLGALQSGAVVEIDAAEVEAVDGAGLQLLAGFAKSAGERNVSVVWRKPSPVLSQALDRIGLGALLQAQ